MVELTLNPRVDSSINTLVNPTEGIINQFGNSIEELKSLRVKKKMWRDGKMEAIRVLITFEPHNTTSHKPQSSQKTKVEMVANGGA